MQHDSRGQPEVILRAAEQACLQHLRLHAPTNSVKQPIVNSPAQGGRKGRVRIREARSALADVRSPEQSVRKWGEFSNGNRNPRAEQGVMYARIDAEGWGDGNVSRTIKTADISYKSDPGKDFASSEPFQPFRLVRSFDEKSALA